MCWAWAKLEKILAELRYTLDVLEKEEGDVKAPPGFVLPGREGKGKGQEYMLIILVKVSQNTL